MSRMPTRFSACGHQGWGYTDYRREFRAYRRAISAAAPGVRIAGPDNVVPA